MADIVRYRGAWTKQRRSGTRPAAAAALLAFLSNVIGKQPGSPLQSRIAGAMAFYRHLAR